MITNDFIIFANIYHKNIFPNEKSNIYITKSNKNISYYKNFNKLKKKDWVGVIDNNTVDIKCIKNKINNQLYYYKINLTLNWDKYKQTVNYSNNYNPNFLIKSRNPFPNIILNS